MNSQYKYRSHLNYIKWIVPIIIVASILIDWLGRDPFESSNPYIISSIIQAILAFAIWRFLHKFSLIRVTIDEKAITYSNNKGDQRVEYDEIKELKFPSVRYTGGWMKIISNKKPIRITVVLENIHKLLLEIKEELDRRGLSDRYDKKKFFKFLKTSVHADASWQRIWRIWIKLIVATIITTMIGVGVALIFDVGNFIIVFVIFSCIFPTIVYYITEIVFRRRVTKLSGFDSFTVPERDTIFEKSVYKKAILIGTVAYFVVIIFIAWIQVSSQYINV